MYADIVVMDTFHDDPYRNLIEAIDADVRLTVVQGKAVFGDVDIMTAINQDDWEPISGGGVSKAVDVTSMSETDGMQTWESIQAGMAMAMRNDVSDIREHWSAPDNVPWSTDEEVQAYLDTEFDGKNAANTGISQLKNMTVDPIFTTGDDRYFDVINRSSHGNTHVDLSKLYAYYNISMDADGNRNGVNVDLTVDPADPSNNGGTSGNSGSTDTTDDTDNTDGGEDTTGDITGGEQDNGNTGSTDDSGDTDVDSNAGDSDESSAQLLLIGGAVVLLAALYLVSRGGGDELNLNQEAHIEKMWDDDSLEDATQLASSKPEFVPSLPPMDVNQFLTQRED